ncbi:MAG TPA: hypothetical protein V6C97_22110 [Oculatellaceae cyanobacterium]
MITRTVRVRQLLAQRTTALRIFNTSAQLLEAQLNLRVHPLFGERNVAFLRDNISTAGACVDRLLSLVGPDPDSDESNVVLTTLRSPQGEAAARQFNELRNDLEKKNRTWADQHSLGVLQLDLVEATPLTVHHRMMVNQFKSLSAQAEAIAEIHGSLLALHYLQFWVLPNNAFHFSGEPNASDYMSVKAGEGPFQPEAPEVAAARIPVPSRTRGRRRIRSTKTSLGALQRIHEAQVRFFRQTSNGILKEFRTFKGSSNFFPLVHRAVELLEALGSEYNGIRTSAAQLEGDGNRSPQYIESNGHSFYAYMTARRHLAEHIGDMDEWRKALACVSDVVRESKAYEASDRPRFEEMCRLTWRLLGAQEQINSLARQAEAMTLTEDAIFRGYGLKFWQGTKRWMRWEGDNK